MVNKALVCKGDDCGVVPFAFWGAQAQCDVALDVAFDVDGAALDFGDWPALSHGFECVFGRQWSQLVVVRVVRAGVHSSKNLRCIISAKWWHIVGIKQTRLD